jgi:hypothetical protein
MRNDLARQAEERARLQQIARYEDSIADLHVYLIILKKHKIQFASFSTRKYRIVGGTKVHQNLEIIDMIHKILLTSHEQNGYDNFLFSII